ncbi:MAG: hypothetical protein HY668_02105 [Chloroflexi bacterium]|nr:hypothetical protein [Chloroflexota bacterium]
MTEQITWELVNPEGIVQAERLKTQPRPKTLQSKTALLFWNAKHNGDVFLNKIAELLTSSVAGVKVVKAWEAAPETARQTGTKEDARKIVKRLAEFKPDIVIGAQGD